MRIAQVRPAVSLAAGGFLVVSASSFGIVTAATSGDAGASGRPAVLRAAGAEAGQGQTSQARTSAVSGATQQQCQGLKSPTTSPPASTSANPSQSTTTPASNTPATPSVAPTTATPSPAPDPTPSNTSSSASPSGSTQTTGLVSPLITGLTSGSAQQTSSTATFASSGGGSTPVTATLLSVTQTDAASPTSLCISVQRDETSVARGQTAQWTVKVWSQGDSVSNVKVTLAASPSGQKPVFSFGCSKKEGTNSCAFATVDSDARELQAQVHIAKSATSVKSVKLTATASGSNVSTPYPKAAEPITVTAPPASASPSASASSSAATSAAAVPGVATTVPQPNGVTSQLGVGKLPFLNGSGSALNPGGNASSLFPKLNPSSGSLPTLSGHGSARTRQVAEALPADASVMGAQYAGLAALALAFVLSVTRLSIRRRHAAKSGSGNSN